MSTDEKYQFNVIKGKTYHILDQDGNINRSLDPGLPDSLLLKFYRLMLQGRIFDDKALKMQRAGRMGTYPPISGQEAVQVGSALALKDTDWMVPSYRDIASMMAIGIPLKDLYLVWMGNDLGNKIPDGIKCLPISIVVGSQMLHAAGFAWAANIKKENLAVLTYFGDGATSRGDFHEALNFAGVFNVPAVFICENNQFAISTRMKQQTKAETLAQKGLSYGIKCYQVDGMDVLAVYSLVKEALDRVRNKEGPVLIEALCYRYGPHTTADNPDLYRTKEELEKIISENDPIIRLKNYLIKKGIWNEDKEKALVEELGRIVNNAAKEAEDTPAPAFDELVKNVFSDTPDYLKEELEYYNKTAGGK